MAGASSATPTVVTDGAGLGLMLRAALPALPGANLLPGLRKQPDGDLAALAMTRPDVEVTRDHVDAYARVCGFPTKDTAPLPYVHVLAFPLHLRIMTDPRFPFPAMGSIHITNTITGHRPIGVGETVSITVHPEHLAAHPKGRTVDFVAEVRAGEELVWESRSTYLRRGSSGSSDAGAPGQDEPERDEPGRHEAERDEPGAAYAVVPGAGITWRLPGDLGRRYAAVSGDRNPIHLYGLTAKAFGFPRQIAHGMWSTARCIAALENRLPDAVTVGVAFKKPLLLPGTVAFGVRATDTGHAFSLTNARTGAPHLVGATSPA